MVFKKYHAYLSGGMEYANNEGVDWRNEIENWIIQKLKHIVFNPNKESQKLLTKLLPQKNFRELKSTDIDTYINIAKRFIDKDSKEIALRSDYIICYWDESAQRGAGTKGELTLARYFKKPVYMVTNISRQQIPGWVLGCVTSTYDSFELLQVFLMKKYGYKNITSTGKKNDQRKSKIGKGLS
jgi:hypothetical protein